MLFFIWPVWPGILLLVVAIRYVYGIICKTFAFAQCLVLEYTKKMQDVRIYDINVSESDMSDAIVVTILHDDDI